VAKPFDPDRLTAVVANLAGISLSVPSEGRIETKRTVS
jgi:hypothetical protein